jgi:hypothetical protein
MDGNVDLSLLRARLLDTTRPESLIVWLYQEHVRELLHGLSVGLISLTHQGLDDFPRPQAADHIRGLLVAVGLLPVRQRPIRPRVYPRAACARCRRPDQPVAKVMPDGPLCAACRSEAVRHRGHCDGCGRERLLPAVDSDGGRLCCRCAGIDENYTCSRCGTEWALQRGLCEWCYLGDILDDLIDGPVDLSRLRAQLLKAARPDRLIIWVYQAHVQELLHGLSAGTIALTHQGLDHFAHRPAADHLRGLLVAAGLLPSRDERLAHFDRWVSERLPQVPVMGDDVKLLQQFASWQLRRHLVTQSQKGPLRDEQVTNAIQNLRLAASLLAWLHQRERDLASCTQHDVDEWFTTPPATRAHAAAFMRWAITTRRCPKLALPKRQQGTAPVLDHTQRVDILRRILSPDTGRLEHRVAAILLVLAGQPFTKIATLTVEDVVLDGETTGIRLGQGVTAIPPPFGAMVRELLARRPNLNTAANPTSPWLFPGRNAGSHLRSSTLRRRVKEMDVNLLGARSGALRQLVLDCPPPVVADMLGYSYQAMDRHALRAGSPWSSYAALRAQTR